MVYKIEELLIEKYKVKRKKKEEEDAETIQRKKDMQEKLFEDAKRSQSVMDYALPTEPPKLGPMKSEGQFPSSLNVIIEQKKDDINFDDIQ